MVLQLDFHGCGFIFLTFARWIPGPPWFPVEPDLPSVTPSYNRPQPLDTSESRLKSIFDVSQIRLSLLGNVRIIFNADINKKSRIRHMHPQNAWNSQNCQCLPRCASASLVLTRFAITFALFVNKSIHGLLNERPNDALV